MPLATESTRSRAAPLVVCCRTVGGGKQTESKIVRRELVALSRAWHVDLRDVQVKISSRLRTSMGRADLARGRVSVAVSATKDRRLFREVLRHELAHVAASRLGAKGEGHHGPTWRGLLLAIGAAPRVRIPLPGVQRRPPTRLFRHECSVCDFARIAKRRVPAWRCADCVAAGLAGRLTITEVSS